MTQILAGRLSLDHIGKTITVQQRGTTITGVLSGYSIAGNLINDTQFGDNGVTRWALGNVTVRMSIVPDIEASLDARDRVEVAPILRRCHLCMGDGCEPTTPLDKTQAPRPCSGCAGTGEVAE